MNFTAHNIRLDDGTLTKPDVGVEMASHHVFSAAKRTLDVIFPGDKNGYRLVDLGCLEGGYAVEFARMGFDVTGIEVRESNFAACQYVKSRINLPNLRFVLDDAWNVEKYGRFDAVFCCGLLYHIERPVKFMRLLSSVCKRALFLDTHFACGGFWLDENEGAKGRWFREFRDDAEFSIRDSMRWASWDNRRSFWLQREYLLQAIRDASFSIVMEQFDALGNIAESMLRGGYRKHSRGTFIGVK